MSAAHQPTEAAAVPTPAPDEQPIEWIDRVVDDRYRVIRMLGEGGMGAVFVAEHLTLHKAVALKVIRAELAGNGEVAARFAREAMATARFEHPHVASAIDFGTLPEGGAYFVMQLVRGKSLRGLCTRGKRLPWRRAAEICAQVADALSAAKAHGIIHRDLKPDNILVEQREDGSDLVKVLDFGIAHVAPRDAGSTVEGTHSRQLTRVGTVMGTPGYMSPEQAVGDKVDYRTDLYALGVVLWECITGRELWDGPDLTTVVTRQMSESVPKLRDAAQDPLIPGELDDLVQRLTSRTVTDRPEHASEVRDGLRKLSHADVDGIRISTAGVRIFVSEARPRVQRAIEVFRAQPPRRKGMQTAAVLAALFVLGGALIGERSSSDGAAGANGAPVATAGSAGAAANGSAPTAETPAGAASAPALDRVAAAAERAVARVKQAVGAGPAPAAQPVQMPAVLAQDATDLIESDNARDRRSAADAILAFRPRESVLPHMLLIAEFETAHSCKSRKQVIAKMQLAPDARYLRPLERMAHSPRSGCGFLSLSDCYSCVRPELRRAINAIERATGQPETE